MKPRTFARCLAAAAFAIAIAVAAPATAAHARPDSAFAESLATARSILRDVASGRVSAGELAAASASSTTAVAAMAATAPALSDGAIVGTWLIDVPGSAEAPGFRALQTFGTGGTFVETSDLLGQLFEGPAHGNYRRIGTNRYLLTFLVFEFDEDGNPAGHVRVRCRIQLSGDRLNADTEVDVIAPDGELIPNVGGGPFSGVRIPIVGLAE